MSEDRKRRVQESFSKNKEAYVQSSTHNNRSDLELVVEWLKPEKNWRALDIATGGGHVAKAMSPWVDSVFATDLTKDMLQNTAFHLRNQTNIHYVIADAEKLPFIDGSFEVVTCRIAPHHFPEPDRFIKEVKRVLQPGGRFLMIDNVAQEDDALDRFYNTLEQMRDSSHVRALRISEWEHLFRKHDLVIKKSLINKKKLPFREWVERTLDTQVEQQKVEMYLKKASQQASSYFAVEQQQDTIESFTIDEWFALSQKEF